MGEEEKKLTEETIFSDTGQGFSKTDNTPLATDSWKPTNSKKDTYKEISKFWCIVSKKNYWNPMTKFFKDGLFSNVQ